MGRGARIAVFGLALGLLLGFSGCSWPGARRTSLRDALSPERAERVQAISERAQAALDAGDLDLAEREFRQLVALSPKSPEGYQRLGKVLMLRERPDEAGVNFEKALTLDPDFVGALIGLGEIEAARGDSQSAVKRFETAVEIEPRDAAAQLALGRELEAKGKADEALAAYFRALENDPFSIEASRRVASIQLARDDADQALARLDQTIEMAPADAEVLLLRGRAHLALRHVPEAVADLRTASLRLPQRPDVHFFLALALDAASRPGDALKSAEQALKLAPDYADAQSLTERLRR